MLSKIFKKTETTPVETAATKAANKAAEKAKASDDAAKQAAETAKQVSVTWQPKLDAAIAATDDAALLAIANEAPSVDIKLAAVTALTSEETLKLAEREFRTHDRRVHRTAKQRLEAAVAQREAREAAAKLIDSAKALVQEAKIPANRLVELDRAWLALDIALLHPAQRDEFAALAADLTTLTRERGEHQLHLNRWTADAKQASLHLNVTAGDVAAGIKDRTMLAPARDQAAALLKTAPEGDAVAALVAALQTGLQTSEQIEVRLALLDELVPVAAAPAVTPVVDAAPAVAAEPAPLAEGKIEGVAAASEPVAEVAPTPQPTPAPPPNFAARWHALPPIADAQVASLLNARFDQWQRGQTDAKKAHHAEKRQAANEQKNAIKTERNQMLAELLQKAETTLAEGHLVETNKQLVAIDEALENGAPAGALRGRIDRLQAEYARLKGWQHWGGGRVRDDLVLEAEALAKTIAPPSTPEPVLASTTEPATVLAAPENMVETQPETPTHAEAEAANATVAAETPSAISADAKTETTSLEVTNTVSTEAATTEAAAEASATSPLKRERPPRPTKKPAAKLPPKFSIKQHADAIEKLRERWKELDKLGGASSRSLWKRFDAALKIAYVPVGEHLAKLKAVRMENLEARNQLIKALEAVKLADEGATQDYRELSRALDHFQTEWRKSGPVEHTVPHKSREKLLEHMRIAMARLEAPLQEARRVAQTEREKFIARAKALSADAAAKPASRDIIPKIRELQTEWQHHAKALPLARNVENALWNEFKAATDSVFTQRDAAFSARDEEFKAHRDAREALIARLNALTADTNAGEIKRTMSDVDSAWRRAGEVKRDDTAKIEARFRAARDTASKHLAGSANRVWYGICDSLHAKIALCVEAQSATPDTEIESRWQALSALPPLWEQALKARLKSAADAVTSAKPTSAKPANVGACDATLLQLESALDIASPPASQAARRDLKLRAMKAALEGKPVSGAPSRTIEQLIAEALGHTELDAAQQSRFAAVMAAVRERGHARE